MRWVSIPVALLALALVWTLGAVGAQAGNDELAARWIHAQLNQWRLGLGTLGPLAYNETLARMALDQATYLASKPQLPPSSAIHNGRTGELARDRAVWPEYAWPDYGVPGQILLSEITWVGEPEDALEFWHESQIHRQSATNLWYREVGVAAVPYARNGIKGHVFVAVLGARPNVLPAMADPSAGVLYLTDETYRGARNQTIRGVQQYRLFDEAGRPLTNGWASWAPQVALPANAGNEIHVLYSDGDRQTMADASLVGSDIPLPAYEEAWRLKAVAQIIPTAAPTPTPTPPPPPRIRIAYNNYGLTLLNTVPTRADVRSLRLLGDNGSLIVNDMRPPNNGTLRSLPMNSCLTYGLDSPRLDIPDECRYRSQTVATLRSQLFWTRGDFTVYRGDELLATCRQADEECEFDLPQ